MTASAAEAACQGSVGVESSESGSTAVSEPSAEESSSPSQVNAKSDVPGHMDEELGITPPPDAIHNDFME